jgi:hypothetical protein
MGYNPLPSHVEIKRPAMKTYAHERDHGLPPEAVERWWAPNVQVALGARWRLCVVDLGGPPAVQVWAARLAGVADHLRGEETWIVETPSGGVHLWYATPVHWTRAWNAALWVGEGKHSRVDLLGDGMLAMAPPSYRTIDGEVRHYRFVEGYSPASMPRPATLPNWVEVWAWEARGRLAEPGSGWARSSPPPLALPKLRSKRWGRHWAREVHAALTPQMRLEVAREWGLEIPRDAVRSNARGWVPCRVIGREDRTPSAMFNVNSGCYHETPPAGRVVKFFDLAVELGRFSRWQDARDELGARLGLVPSEARTEHVHG